VRFLVGCLDERGFLSPSDEELLALALEAGLAGGRSRLGAAIAALQELEPRGIGARNAIEALLLQLDPADPDYDLLCRLLEEFVEELAKNRLPQVARAMGLELADLERLLDLLRELDPAPAASLVEEAAPVIVPEVMVEAAGEGWEVSVPRSALPAVSVDPSVADLARDRAQGAEVRRYLRGKLDQARWIVEAVAHRGETLLRVARAAFAHQRAFLEEGPGHLAPLTMGAVADELGLHVSTVSRAVAGKFAQTPWGCLPLRSLFQSAAGGEDTARDEVREAVRALFEGEDKTRPLSDEEAVAALAERGLTVARRTVAKYRKELGIPSSYRRRRFQE
jgi:RNA polymerase sigma-54 factor